MSSLAGLAAAQRPAGTQAGLAGHGLPAYQAGSPRPARAGLSCRQSWPAGACLRGPARQPHPVIPGVRRPGPGPLRSLAPRV